MPFGSVTDEFLAQLRALVGVDAVSVAEADRQLHAADMSSHPPHLSDVVVWPTTAQQVADVLRLANVYAIPVTPWGVGSSLEGNPIPLYGGISLSTERMQGIVAIHEDDFQVTVQPGIGYKDLNKKLAPYGLFFPPDPGANATIGGMLANNAAGIRTVKYGASKDNVLRMEVALADGRLIHVGSRSIKQSSGYDLLHLFVGSEGTLGVITEATLKLTPIPALMSAVVASFADVETAVTAVVAIKGTGLDLAALDFIDATTAAMLAQENGIDIPENPTLLMEFHATHEETIQLGLDMVREICDEMGAVRVQATADPTTRQHLWHARHQTFETKVRLHPGTHWMPMDVAVPISAYPALVAYAEQAMQAQGVSGFLIGHAGDGNMHFTLAYQDEPSHTRATSVSTTIVRKAVDLGGTATGEHGVGIGKSPFMPYEHGLALDVMKQIKQTLDPKGILNPGKIFIM